MGLLFSIRALIYFLCIRNILMRKTDLKEKYPWLKITTSIEDYVEPTYYDSLLKDYTFGGLSDLDMFSGFLERYKDRNDLRVLELGSGTGRATDLLLEKVSPEDLTLVDLSDRMILTTREKFAQKNIHFEVSDSLAYLGKTEKQFDLVFSLWSYSHSFYQLIERLGLEEGVKQVKDTWIKFIKENLNPGAALFLIHSDWLSDEQKILIRQWGRDMPELYQSGKQGISKLVLDEIFDELNGSGLIEYSITPYKGDPIRYSSIDEALEVFINFHLESYFNNTPYIEEVVKDLKEYFSIFKASDGSVSIRPACFVYICKKLN